MTVDTLSLEGKVAIVTGSGRENGIGAGIALALARNGASVLVNYTSDSTVERAHAVARMLREAGGEAAVVQASVTSLDGAKAIAQAALKEFKTSHVDILVNNAGFWQQVDMFSDLDEESLDKVYEVNARGPMYMINAVIPYMPPGGRIVNVSSTVAKTGDSNTVFYAAAKAAVDNLSYSLAMVLGRSKGITVNSVNPGPVFTELMSCEMHRAILQPYVERTPAADRVGTPADIGDAVLLLVNEKARWITGQNISVDGGLSR